MCDEGRSQIISGYRQTEKPSQQFCSSMSEYVTSELWSWDQQEERGRASKPSEVDMMSMAQQIKPNGMQVLIRFAKYIN
jgi:hypothetical protein